MPKIYISFDDNTDYTLSPSERNWVAAQLQLACDTAELETGVLLAAGVESPGTPIKMQGTMYSWIDHTNIADQDEMISPAELYARIAERAGVMLNDKDEIYGYTWRCVLDGCRPSWRSAPACSPTASTPSRTRTCTARATISPS